MSWETKATPQFKWEVDPSHLEQNEFGAESSLRDALKSVLVVASK